MASPPTFEIILVFRKVFKADHRMIAREPRRPGSWLRNAPFVIVEHACGAREHLTLGGNPELAADYHASVNCAVRFPFLRKFDSHINCVVKWPCVSLRYWQRDTPTVVVFDFD